MNYSERLHITVKARLKMFETLKTDLPNQKDVDPVLEEYHKLIEIAEAVFCLNDCDGEGCDYVSDCTKMEEKW